MGQQILRSSFPKNQATKTRKGLLCGHSGRTSNNLLLLGDLLQSDDSHQNQSGRGVRVNLIQGQYGLSAVRHDWNYGCGQNLVQQLVVHESQSGFLKTRHRCTTHFERQLIRRQIFQIRRQSFKTEKLCRSIGLRIRARLQRNLRN